MIHLKCPKCDNVVEVPDEQAGQITACPHCGNVSIVPFPARAVLSAEVQPTPPSPGEAPAAALPAVSDEEKNARMWAMFCHLAGLALFVQIPFGNIIGPLVIWLVQKDKHPFIAQQGRESLNFQISIMIYMLISAILILVVVGIFLLIALALLDLILVIVATINASDGRAYRYPITIRLIK
jgi:uncharacterized Tic20 family protein/ribosomal protein S27E